MRVTRIRLGCAHTTTQPPPNAPKPWGRDFTTSRAWIDDELREEKLSGLSYCLSTLGTAAFALFLLTGAFIALKRLLTYLLPLVLPGSWLGS